MSMRSATFRSVPIVEAEPLSAMNMTPLIDVLLVLLVMMILTIPMMTHKVPVDLPPPGETGLPVTHRIDLDAGGRLAWNGAPIADAALPARLAAMLREPNARLEIRADAAARYERFDQTLAVIKRAGVTKLGFVGNERFANFDGGE
jgi:biopolymer transport protein ExbD